MMLLTRQKTGSVGGQPSPPGGLDVGYQEVTPELAAKWLSNNPANRSLRKQAVASLARAMSAGEFNGANGETIKLNRSGALVDGQHRLAAIVKSGTVQGLLVVRGVPDGAADTMDTGMQRTFADVLRRRGVKQSNNVAATARLLWLYDNSGRMMGGNVKPTYGEMLDVLAANPVVVHKNAFSDLVGLTNATFLRVIFERASLADAEAFITRAGDGVGLAKGDPILVFRERVIRWRSASPGQKAHNAFVLAWAIKAFNAWRRGDSITVLRWNPGGAVREDFPRVEDVPA